MADRLKGKVAIVSGGAGGCGAAAVRLFAAEGAAVGIIDRDATRGVALAEELVAAGYRVMFAGANVALKAEVDAAVAAVTATLGRRITRTRSMPAAASAAVFAALSR